MKTIGMIGGMSWESTRVYYDIVNREVQKRLGGAHSAIPSTSMRSRSCSGGAAGPKPRSAWSALRSR